MEPADGPRFLPWSIPVYAPDCKSCLRIVGCSLESQPTDERIPLVVDLAMQEVSQFGSSRVAGIPGDQAEVLRAAFSAALRRTGLRGRTYLLETILFVVSEDAWNALSQDRKGALDAQLADTLDWLEGDEPNPTRRRGVDWKTWGIL